MTQAPTQSSNLPATNRLTASRLALGSKCPGSFAYPHDGELGNGPASKGTAVHAFIEALLADGSCEPGRVDNPEARAVCERLLPADLIAASGASLGDLHVEVAFAYEATTGEARVLDGGGHRDYSAAPAGSVCGTADVVAFWDEVDPDAGGPSGRILVTDWKTGGAVDPPRENLQLAFLALAAKKALGRTGDRVAAQIAYLDSSGGLSTSLHEFADPELEEAEERIRKIVRSVEESRGVAGATAGTGGEAPWLVTGSHCRFCPAIARCPAIAGAAQALIDEKEGQLTPSSAAAAWERLQAVEAAAKKARAALSSFVASERCEGSVVLPGGSSLRIVESRREKIDPALAMPVLRGAFGERADAAVSVSKTGLKRLVGDRLSFLMDELEGAGAVEVSHSESLREVGKRS
jgi:hypothetical protein